MTEDMCEHPGFEVARLWWLAALRAPCLPLGAGGAGSGPTALSWSSSYLGEVLGLSGYDRGAGLAGRVVLPGCVTMCIRPGRLQGCGAQREIVEFMDICKTA